MNYKSKQESNIVYNVFYPVFVLVIIWWLFSSIINTRFVPGPLNVILVFLQKFNIIFSHVLFSAYRIILASIITMIIGIPIGIYIAVHPKSDSFISPIIYMLYPIPKIAFLPLLMLFFGLGDLSKIILIGIIIFFQILISTRDSVKNINPAYFLSIKSLGANKKQIYQHVIIPAILPNLFTALRLSIGTSISVLFFAENFSTRYGIGYYIMDSWLKISYSEMFAGIIAISIFGIGMFKSIDFFENKLCKWNKM